MIITIYGGSKKTRKQREKEKQAWKDQQEKYKFAYSQNPKKAWTPEVVNSTSSRLNLNSHRLSSNYPSRDSGIGVAPKKANTTYTGDNLIGIGNLHKSNLVPVFKGEEAIDLAKMRR